jgi:diguanylate cyclase (GGDEF)-like protein/PAS domain S-box-containing protein
MTLHRLLNRQIKRHLGEGAAIDAQWKSLLEAISAFYVEIDRERELMQNALAVNSSELTEANEQLRIRNRELMQTMLNTLSEGVYATDVNGVITFMNLSAEQIFGRSEREMIGRRALDLIHHERPGGDSHAAEDCPLLEVSKMGVSASGEEYFIHRHGHFIPVSFRSNPLKHEGKLLGSLVSFRDISDRLKSEERIYQIAFFDSLAGLPNRRLLLDRLGQAMAVSARQQQYGAVLFVDIDHFKVINDTLGHESGDLMLQQVAQRMRSVLRQEDTVARLGGDEFVVMLEELDADRSRAAAQAKHVGDEILETLYAPLLIDDKECNCTASIGVVMFRGHDESLDEILKRSDLAMYDAKRVGRNMLRFFDPAMQLELEKRTVLEADLRRALVEGQFKLYFQKRVDSHGHTRGAEALLRWLRPDRGVVPPIEFIPLSEETGLIVPIGYWVLREACRRLKAWEENPDTRNLVLSGNVSAREFEQEDFVEKKKHTIRDTGANASLLELEITESMLLENIDSFINKMRMHHEEEITFALDDFGTGYSSLSYLKKLPLHKLKIDQSFIRDLEVDKNDEAIVETIIQIGKTLGLEVIAEGVETHSQCKMLEHYGCNNFQGYLFGKPVPIENFEEELEGMALAT